VSCTNLFGRYCREFLVPIWEILQGVPCTHLGDIAGSCLSIWCLSPPLGQGTYIIHFCGLILESYFPAPSFLLSRTELKVYLWAQAPPDSSCSFITYLHPSFSHFILKMNTARCLDNYALFNSATDSYNTYNNYTTRHL
jgi:hypothetical protein